MADRPAPPLLPRPRSFVRRAGSFSLRDGTPIVLTAGADDAAFFAAQTLRRFAAERCGVSPPIETHARSDDLGPRLELRVEPRVEEAAGAGGEAYRLEVGHDRVQAVGDGAAGLHYAVETLSQLLAPSGRIPCARIEDAPDFALRGLMLDVSRGKVPTAETLRAVVDHCVRLKLNALMLYVEHPFQWRRHPRIGEGASPLDARTLRELDAYAARRHVELIPSLQSLGHMERILSLDEYAHLAESEARWTLSPADEGSYALLSDLYDEFLGNFRSRRFNANCDEPFDLPRGRSRQREHELGPGGVYLEHVRRVRDLARRHGKQTMIWGDVVHSHPQRIAELDRDLVLLDWWYEADHDYERVARFSEAGLAFVVCPGTSSWNALFPRVDNSLANIARYAEAGRRHGARGLLLTDWGDGGHPNLLGGSWLAVAWAAQQAWSGDAPARDFDRAFARRLFDDDGSVSARLYRELGAIHDAGFPAFNASPLQLLFFDDLDTAYFADGAKPAALQRSLRRVARLASRLEGSSDAFRRETLAGDELRWSADATSLALRKALAARRYLAWRRRPRSLDAPGRRRLAREVADLAAEQASSGRRLRALWLRRNHPSEWRITARRLDRSVRSLRRAARALGRNAPPPPPPGHPGFDVGSVFRALRAQLE